VKTSIKYGLVAATMSLAAPFAAHAQDSESPLPGTLTGNVAIVSDYMFRGLSQTTNNAAVQGGLDWDTGMGFTFGTWASTLNFADGNNATTELDLYGGYGGSIDNFTYGVGFIYYWYPGATSAAQYDMWEVYGKVGYDFGLAATSFAVNYTPNNTITNLDSTYFAVGLTVPVADLLSVSANFGYSSLETLKDYTDYNIGATLKVYDWFDVDARFYDTDITTGCPVGTSRICDERFVVKISRVF